ncbi:MAG: FKBP-type peptidyl-prolyl cis-trans isomerase [Bacteroidota bacterium]|nr:FKBP-type peptidyl-prolyl cis-trans isomerase [Bacteroidota bacterium]
MQRIALIFLSIILNSFFLLGQNKTNTKAKVAAKPTSINQKTTIKKPMYDTINAPGGLQIIITQKNKNPKAEEGDQVKVHYIGKLTNGTVFDESVGRGQPFEFILGSHMVIEGWDQGIKYLGKGEKATLIIPAAMGYGENGQGPIPGNSILIFDVELVDVVKPIPISLEGKEVLTTASGIKYYYLQKGNGRKTKKGDNVSVHYTGKLMKGKKFDSSLDRGEPFTVALGQGRVIQGWEEALALMNVGDKAAFVIPPALAYGTREVGGGIIPPNSTLYFEIEVLDAQEEGTETIVPGEQPTFGKCQSHPLDVAGQKIETTASGLQYIIVKKSGSGKKPAAGQTVFVHYTGSLANGKKFDSSVDRGEPLPFPLGQGRVIKGWDEGIALMEVGDCIRLIIPPNLGYGAADKGTIPPNSTLIFDCELMGIQ